MDPGASRFRKILRWNGYALGAPSGPDRHARRRIRFNASVESTVVARCSNPGAARRRFGCDHHHRVRSRLLPGNYGGSARSAVMAGTPVVSFHIAPRSGGARPHMKIRGGEFLLRGPETIFTPEQFTEEHHAI